MPAQSAHLSGGCLVCCRPPVRGQPDLCAFQQGVSNNYDTDLILPIVLEAARLAGVDYRTADAKTQTSLRVIGDHTRAVRDSSMYRSVLHVSAAALASFVVRPL